MKKTAICIFLFSTQIIFSQNLDFKTIKILNIFPSINSDFTLLDSLIKYPLDSTTWEEIPCSYLENAIYDYNHIIVEQVLIKAGSSNRIKSVKMASCSSVILNDEIGFDIYELKFDNCRLSKEFYKKITQNSLFEIKYNDGIENLIFWHFNEFVYFIKIDCEFVSLVQANYYKKKLIESLNRLN
jgi:hypothetical protein